MPDKSTPQTNIQAYLRVWNRRGTSANEGDLYDLFATNVVRGILGYTPEEYNITPRGKRGSGAPDLRLKTADGTAWVAVEAKTDDRLIRRRCDRDRLWNDKKKYIDDETAYFLWVAPQTFLLCDVSGKEIVGIRLETGQAELDLELEDRVWHQATTDQEVAALLEPISAEAGRERKYLERFRAGELPYGYIKVTSETVDKLTASLSACTDILLDYLRRSQFSLKTGYDTYVPERRGYEEEVEQATAWQYEGDELVARREMLMRAFDRRHQPEIRFHRAFEDFCAEQAYTKYEKERNENERTALERIFRANAAYVAIGRLLFVRLAEDQKLIRPKISNGGLKAWRMVLDNGDLVAHWVGLAFADAQRVCRQLYAETPFDALMLVDDSRFDEALLRVLYRLNAFDLSGLSNDVDVLGAIYQGILDRKLRKDLGEFYTDQEVVEYILSRVGLRDAVEAGAQVRLLDPACGSGAFLVQAAGIVKDADSKRGLPKPDMQERIGAAIHGLDINHFAVYIADMNLLFATFDLTAETRQPARFSVHRMNSLLRDTLVQFVSTSSPVEGAEADRDAAQCRDSTYGFVVGNPPYVRAERLPDEDRDQLKRQYADMHDGGNVDLAVYFIRRALDWLEPGGMLGLILPRAIADAAFARPVRELLEREDYTIEELVPLDWACHELFDSDVVPFLLFVRKSPRPADHKITLIQGLRSRADLLARARGQTPTGTRTSRVPWAAFSRLSESAWPLEITAEDVPVIEKLRSFPKLHTVATSRFGVKAGSTNAAHDIDAKTTAEAGWLPMLTGSEIHAFHSEPPRRAVVLSKASDPSLWATPGRGGSVRVLPAAIVAVPEIHVTMNATVIDPRALCCQNNALVVRPNTPTDPSPYALAALLNSRSARYCAFLTLRAGVTGGGRRDFTIYPRTLNAIPVPGLTSSNWARLDRLSRMAHTLGAQRAESEATIWRKCVSGELSALVREWPLDFGGWPDGTALTEDHFAPELDESEGRLWLSPKASLSGDISLLRYLVNHLTAYFGEAVELTKTAFMRHKVVPVELAAEILSDFDTALHSRNRAENRFRRATELIDDIVETGFGLSPELRERISRRMLEFPLCDTANRPRLPWEVSKKPKSRQFVEGERYHTM